MIDDLIDIGGGGDDSSGIISERFLFLVARIGTVTIKRIFNAQNNFIADIIVISTISVQFSHAPVPFFGTPQIRFFGQSVRGGAAANHTVEWGAAFDATQIGHGMSFTRCCFRWQGDDVSSI